MPVSPPIPMCRPPFSRSRKRRWPLIGCVLGGLLGVWGLLGVPAGAAATTTSAQNLMEQGIREVSLYNFQLGRELLQKALSQLPETEIGHPLWQQIVYGLAVAHHQATPATREHIQTAERLFRELVTLAPQSPFLSRTFMNLGRLAEMRHYRGDAVDRDAAERWYHQAMQSGAGQPVEHEAAMRIAGLFLQQHEDPQQVRHGIGLLADHLQRHPDNFFAGPMWQLIGEAHAVLLGEPDAAADAFVQADAHGLISGQVGHFYWRIARADEAAGRLERAITYYKKIITDTPNSGRADEAQQRLQALHQQHPKLVGEIPTIELLLRAAPSSDLSPAPKAPSQETQP